MSFGRKGPLSTPGLVSVAAAIYLVVTLWLTRGAVPLPPDTVQYAEVARSLVRGLGYTINMVVFHPGYYPQVRHIPEMHGLLQPLLVAPLFLVFGPIGALSRVPGLVFVAALAVVCFRLARTLFGTLAGVLAAAWILGSASFLFMAILGADDVGAALFSTVAVLGFVEALETQRASWLLVAGLAAGAATLEKFTGIVLPFVLGAAIVAVPSARARIGVRGWGLLAAPAFGAAALYCLRNYLVHGGLGFRFGAIDWASKDAPGAYFAFYDRVPSLLGVWAKLGSRRVLELVLEQVKLLAAGSREAPVSMLGGPLALLWCIRRRPAFAALGVAYTAAMLFVVCVVYHVEMRYLSVLQPLFAVAVAGACSALVHQVLEVTPSPWHARVKVAGALAALLLFGRALSHSLDIEGRTVRPGPTRHACEGTTEFIRAHVEAKDVVLTANPWLVAWDLNRAAVNMPTNYERSLVGVIRHYGAAYALVGSPTTGAADVRAALLWLVRSGAPFHPELAYDEGDCALYSLVPGSAR
jgi:4-amino-4-deoxy-L-arabinose transferase-like glycosyltransferase